MKKLFSLVLFLVSVSLFSQKQLEYYNPNQSYEKAYTAYSESNYDKALEYISKIHKNDSIYKMAMSLAGNVHMAMENYEEVVKISDNAIEPFNDYNYYFYLNKGVALLRMENFTEAVTLFETMIEQYPGNYLAYFNLAIGYELNGQLKKAVETYKQCITLNPYFSSGHLRLGNIAYAEGHVTQALLCYNTYLMISPTDDGSLDVLVHMNNMVSEKNDIDPKGIQLSKDDEAFKEIDLLINNYVALNKQYKIDNKIDIALVKQNHAVFEYLNNFEGNGGFWDKNYVSFYRELFNQGYFDGFTYRIAQSTTNKSYYKLISKNVKKIDDFTSWAGTEWSTILSRNNVKPDGSPNIEFWYYDEGELSAIGDVDESGNYIGDWKFFHRNGKVSTEAHFDENGERHGYWKWYHENGALKEDGNYQHGKLEGAGSYYFTNGKIQKVNNYKYDELHGEERVYTKFGALTEKSSYVNGKLNGKGTLNYLVGEVAPMYKVSYTDGEIDGELTKYYANGSTELIMHFANGVPVNEEVHYFENGNKKALYNYTDGKLNGAYTLYYANGNVEEEGKYLNDFKTGEWKTYYSDGTLATEENYDDEGNYTGVFKEYDYNGKLLTEYEYKRNDVKAYKYFNEDGSILIEDAKKQGKFNYVGYSAFRTKVTEGEYLFEGGKDGVWKYYSQYEVLKSQEEYDQGLASGTRKDFFADGKSVSYSTEYDNDLANGYYLSYFYNGNIESEAYYVDGKSERFYNGYYIDGTPKYKRFYFHDKLQGEQLLYAPDGKLNSKEIYDDGKLLTAIYYDTLGNVIDTLNYANDSLIVRHYANKQVYTKLEYKHGYAHGKAVWYHYNGKLQTEGAFVNDQRNGDWKWYYDNGQLSDVGNYLLGKQEGEWLEYFENGKLMGKATYQNGLQQGESLSYNEDGILITRLNYLDDELHGACYYYSDKGNLQLVRYYNHGYLLGYAYEDENGQLVDMIPIEKGKGKCISYYKNGNKAREIEFFNGTFNNSYLKYHENGELAEIDKYIFGNNNEENIEYNENGQVIVKRTYNYNKLEGEALEYYDNGQLKEKQSFKNGVLHGPTLYYSETGKLEKEELYIDGIVYEARYY